MALHSKSPIDQLKYTESVNNWLRAKVGHLTNEQARLKDELQQSKIWTQLYMWTAAIGWSCLVIYSAFGERLCTGS